ncbi:hypothetical protein BDQ17DRAFT_1348805 [Cyathus striatus]|nr:hypothetical protein BDQ17DRAFT_1348805 [Cyathus striatus]
MTTPSSTDSPRWGRNGAPGSAFSGLGRGRGRPSGRGRGGKSARATGTVARDTIDIDAKQASSAEKPPSSTKPHSIPQPKVNSANVPKSKPPPRHAPRNLNASVHPTTTTSKEAPATPSTTSRPSNRRRRSHATKPVPNPQQKQPNFEDTNLKRSQKSSVSVTPHTGPAKDLPPHLTSTTDIRHNIDILVERVRAVAMSDNRPSTPGSHIDWAGDDDDSLPDLDDWGIVTNLQPSTKKDVISPILMDGLKPLPEPGDKFSSPLIARPSTSTGVHTPSTSHSGPEKSPTNLQTNPINDAREKPTYASNTDRQLTDSSHIVAEIEAHNFQPIVKPLHPSLPRKPVVAPIVNLASRDGAIPMRPPVSGKGVVITEPSDDHFIPDSNSNSLAEERSVDDVVTPSIYAPRAGNLSKPSFIDEIHNLEEGLSASIHAPSKSNVPTLESKFSQEPTFSHTRAHTVGRFSRGSPAENGRFIRSGQSTPRGGNMGGFHSRTHSTPPTGTQRTHTSRPVITGDAISRLARTIGSVSSSPPKPAAVASGE